jgi:hypothetical protein
MPRSQGGSGVNFEGGKIDEGALGAPVGEAEKIGGACAPPTTTGPTVDGG